MKILIDNGHGIETPGRRSPDGVLWECAGCNRLISNLRRRHDEPTPSLSAYYGSVKQSQIINLPQFPDSARVAYSTWRFPAACLSGRRKGA